MNAIVLGLGGRTPSAHSGGNYRPQPWTFYGLGADEEAAETPTTPEAGSQKQDRSWWALAAFAGYLRVRRSRRR